MSKITIISSLSKKAYTIFKNLLICLFLKMEMLRLPLCTMFRKRIKLGIR